jgi:hypothetical protein
LPLALPFSAQFFIFSIENKREINHLRGFSTHLAISRQRRGVRQPSAALFRTPNFSNPVSSVYRGLRRFTSVNPDFPPR